MDDSLTRQWWQRAGTILIVGYLIIAAFTFRDYGVSLDEPVQATYGEMVIDYYASGFQDRRYETFLNLAYYGPLFEVLAAFAYRSVPEWKFEIRHLLIALSAALGLLAVRRTAEHMSDDPRLPVLAMLALLLIPTYYGHTFMNSKDIPLATAFSWSIYALVRLLEQRGSRAVLFAGLVGGLTLGVRIAGLLVFPIVGIAALLHAWLNGVARARGGAILRALAGAAVVAWIVMTVVWPWAHSNPVSRPIEALSATAAFQPRVMSRFAGRTMTNHELPPQYLAHMFAVTTPLPILTLTAVGLAVMLRRLVRREASLAELVVLAWAFAPPLVQILLRSPVYDGTRHLLFVYPAIALIAGTGACAIAAIARSSLGMVAVCAAMLAVVPEMIKLHPYQYAYFNALVGGTVGAAGDYDTEYWGTSYREAADWIAAHRCHGRATSVLMAAEPVVQPALDSFLPPDVRVTASSVRAGTLPPAFDYSVAVTRFDMEKNYAATPVAHRVERMGMTLAVVRGGCRQAGDKDSPSREK